MKAKMIFLLAGVALLSACVSAESTERSPRKVRSEVVAAATEYRDIAEFPGRIEAADDVNLSFRVAGVIDRIAVKEGEFVRKGEVIAYMDDRDYRKPLIILLCVPLLVVGAVFGVLISGKSFGFVAICGILGLIGMMIKNGVVLMDEINLQINEGKEPMEALLDSSAIRFRPVMMASLTTIIGMVPLLPDDMFGPLAATIMGGLLVGTVVTLIFIPILYSILFKVKIR